ncbi:MAG: hypothetical protein KKA64_00990 [Nanoarchaeota archaeon]|nr:hypothetical protein [Nanoarchaeota archaeon]
MNQKNLIKTLLACGLAIGSMQNVYPEPRPNQEDTVIDQEYKQKNPEKVLKDSLFNHEKQDIQRGSSLEKKLIDYSVNPSKEFLLNKHIPEILNNYKGRDKQELLEKYSIMWDYGIDTTYWVIEDMRGKSGDSQRKIEHFGFKKYLEDNLIDKITSLDYSLELYIQGQKPDTEKLREFATILQKIKQTSADKSPIPILRSNPVDYMSKECINTKTHWLDVAVENDLKMLNSKDKFSNYKDLIQNVYSSEQYQKYLKEVIEVNNSHFNAIKKSIHVPFLKIWARPFVSKGVSKETKNASESLNKLCVYLINNAFETNFTGESLLE